ncbi:MAG: hypothetical protein WCA07_05410 [Gloeobacterales cyanobacterium]
MSQRTRLSQLLQAPSQRGSQALFLLGRYSFTGPEAVARDELRPPRNPKERTLKCICLSTAPQTPISPLLLDGLEDEIVKFWCKWA